MRSLKSGLPSALPQFLARQRWFGGKARTIRSVEVSDIVPFFSGTLRSCFILAQVEYTSGPADTYDIPLVWAQDGPPAERLLLAESQSGKPG